MSSTTTTSEPTTSEPTESARGPHDDEPKVESALPPFHRGAALALFFAIIPWLLAGTFAFFKPFKGDPNDVVIGFTIALMLGSPFVALILAGVTVRKLRAIDEDDRPRGLVMARIARGLSLGTVIAGLLYGCFGMTVMRGRQLRRRGRPRVAPLSSGGGWSIGDRPNGSNSTNAIEAPSEVAAAWRHNALTEHASVAAFSHVALDLIAAGAPASLVAACHRDALDEVRHTQLCFEIASAIDGLEQAPAPFPMASDRPHRVPGRLPIIAIAVDALIEGALLEGAAAHVARALSSRAEHPKIRRALAVIAVDEARHAEHGWDVIAWCLASRLASPGELVDELARALDRLPPFAADEGPLADGAGERHGIAGARTLTDAYARAREDVRLRLYALSQARRAIPQMRAESAGTESAAPAH